MNPPSRAALLLQARERLVAPATAPGSVRTPLLAALGAATTALMAAAAVIFGGPAIGPASAQVHPPVSHLAAP